jgi:riboflavin biosynthesis pyrimidine reductase
MTGLAALDVLFDDCPGAEIKLPSALAELYGPLRLPAPGARSYVVSNYVQSIDGVVTLDSGRSAGGPISGHNEHDRAVMGILRSLADAVITGAGTARSVPRHVWTADYVSPDFAAEWEEVRKALGKPRYPLNVIVTGSGKIAAENAVFNQTEAPVLIVTTARGAEKLPRTGAVVSVASDRDELTPQAIIDAVAKESSGNLFLLEAGPALLGQFLAADLLDELFLTVAPQIAGRDDPGKRPGLVSGREFAPDDPRWGRLVSARRAGSHLFLRYALRSSLANTPNTSG